MIFLVTADSLKTVLTEALFGVTPKWSAFSALLAALKFHKTDFISLKVGFGHGSRKFGVKKHIKYTAAPADAIVNNCINLIMGYFIIAVYGQQRNII